MRYPALVLFISLIFFSCSTQKEEKVTDTPPDYDMRTFRLESEGGCANDSSSCASYEITYPVFFSLPNSVVDSISQEINLAMDMGNPGSTVRTFDSMGGEFIKDYEQYHAEFADSPMGWYFDGEVEVDSFSNSLICMIASTSYYTGGAHGGYSTYFINIDPSTGKKISLKDKFKPGFQEPLRQIAENLFNEAYASADSTSDDGFIFEFPDGMFTLNSNYGFTRDGLKYIYNIYEIAPYAAGSQEIIIPYQAIRDWLK